MPANLNDALRLHEAGQIEQAARIYQEILARDPNHADALHLLGVACHQAGDSARAIQLISRAVARSPATAAFHSNLGEVYRTSGQLDRAVQCLRTALRLAPDHVEAASNLALALSAQGQRDEAIALLQRALQSNPQFVNACSNLGNLYRLKGDNATALEYFRQAVKLAPHQADARSNLGQLLLESDQVDEALLHCREAVRLAPKMPEAQNNLGNILRDKGQLAEAKRCYQEALRLQPNLAMTHNNIGQALQEEGKLEEARYWYDQALLKEPMTVRFHCNLASSWQAEDRFDEARDRYEIALQIDPNSAEAHHGLAAILEEDGRTPEAMTHLQEAIRLEPDYAAAHTARGNILEQLGQLDEAKASFREALRHSPRQPGALSQLATTNRGKLPDEDVACMEKLLAEAEAGESPMRRTLLCYGLAQVYDARGDYRRAADHLRRANALRLLDWERRGKCYEPAQHEGFIDDMIATFTPEYFKTRAGFGFDTLRPVFIIGLPRSGTTLIEQVLASHSQVFGAGELRLTRLGFESIPTLLKRSDSVFDCLPAVDRSLVRRLGQQHLDGLRLYDDTAARVVDKMPDNYLFLGYLSILFPRARFIHARRDLRDIAVSCWMTNFKQITWACDPEHIASRFHAYQRLMEHWRKTLPVPLLDIEYEETVRDLEGVARKLLDWCGLDWEPACLAFHQTQRTVRTASVSQVRQPIYTKSVERWRNYEADLAGLFEAVSKAPAT